jgi:hypothetical protein
MPNLTKNVVNFLRFLPVFPKEVSFSSNGNAVVKVSGDPYLVSSLVETYGFKRLSVNKQVNTDGVECVKVYAVSNRGHKLKLSWKVENSKTKSFRIVLFRKPQLKRGLSCI